MAGQLGELFSFLTLNTRLDLKSTALEYVLGMTGSEEGRSFIKRNQDVLRLLLELTTDAQPLISRDAHLALLNLSAVDDIAEHLNDLEVIPRFLEFLVNPKWTHADKVCMILSNLTRQGKGAEAFVKAVTTDGKPSLYQLIDIFDRTGYNKDANFHYLGTVFSNVTQTSTARLLFLDRSRCIIPRLLPYTQFQGSVIRRGGVVGLLRNLCFEDPSPFIHVLLASHQWLLSEEMDLLPSLLLPLAGPEHFGEQEMEQFPVDLQFLPDDKQREPDPDIRRMLIEALMKLCSTQPGRQYLRDRQTYLIVRELHKWETDVQASAACENLVHILIADEPEQGMENLHEIELPQGLGAEAGSPS